MKAPRRILASLGFVIEGLSQIPSSLELEARPPKRERPIPGPETSDRQEMWCDGMLRHFVGMLHCCILQTVTE